jgi:hypothetical protein
MPSLKDFDVARDAAFNCLSASIGLLHVARKPVCEATKAEWIAKSLDQLARALSGAWIAIHKVNDELVRAARPTGPVKAGWMTCATAHHLALDLAGCLEEAIRAIDPKLAPRELRPIWPVPKLLGVEVELVRKHLSAIVAKLATWPLFDAQKVESLIQHERLRAIDWLASACKRPSRPTNAPRGPAEPPSGPEAARPASHTEGHGTAIADLPAPDPAIRAEIEHLRRGSLDPLPRPEVVTLGVLRYYLSVLECPEPDLAKSPDACREYRRILFLVNDIPDIRELSRWCNCMLGEDLTVAASLAVRKRLSQGTRRSFSDVDRLRIVDVVALLGKLPRPEPLASEPAPPARPEWDGEPYDPFVWESPAGPPDTAHEAAADSPADPAPVGTDGRPARTADPATGPADRPNGEPAAAGPTGNLREQRPAATADASGSKAPERRAGRPARKVPRGELDEQAVAILVKNPTLTFKQLAEALGCKPGTLRDKAKCPKLATARASIRAQREAFRGGSTWRDRCPDDDEA